MCITKTTGISLFLWDEDYHRHPLQSASHIQQHQSSKAEPPGAKVKLVRADGPHLIKLLLKPCYKKLHSSNFPHASIIERNLGPLPGFRIWATHFLFQTWWKISTLQNSIKFGQKDKWTNLTTNLHQFIWDFFETRTLAILQSCCSRHQLLHCEIWRFLGNHVCIHRHFKKRKEIPHCLVKEITHGSLQRPCHDFIAISPSIVIKLFTEIELRLVLKFCPQFFNCCLWTLSRVRQNPCASITGSLEHSNVIVSPVDSLPFSTFPRVSSHAADRVSTDLQLLKACFNLGVCTAFISSPLSLYRQPSGAWNLTVSDQP